jgi:hypothetical protein
MDQAPGHPVRFFTVRLHCGRCADTDILDIHTLNRQTPGRPACGCLAGRLRESPDWRRDIDARHNWEYIPNYA